MLRYNGGWGVWGEDAGVRCSHELLEPSAAASPCKQTRHVLPTNDIDCGHFVYLYSISPSSDLILMVTFPLIYYHHYLL